MAHIVKNSGSLATCPHVLVVDDDERINDLVSRYLCDHDYVAMTANDAAGARDMLSSFEFDIAIVDVMMPGEDGLSLTSWISKNYSMPVLLLTALGETEDRIKGLESGADDYLPKPFEPRELTLRIDAILRRSNKKPDNANVATFRVGRWSFDPSSSVLMNGDQVVKLTQAEEALLLALSSQPGQAVSREELARRCGISEAGRTIDVQVARLRRKIEDDSKTPMMLQTVRGKGYRLRVEQS